MSTQRRRLGAAIPATVALAIGSVLCASSAIAIGTCPGNKTEVVIPSETQTVSPLLAYDVNGDGIVCESAKGRKTTYSDNRL